MNSIVDRKSESVGGRNSSSARAVAVSEKHSMALLRFFTLSGLLYVTAAVFTTMLTFGVLRDLFLGATITLFIGMLVGITLFFLSYQSHKPGERR
jgi:hypothetical protein